PKGYLNSLRRKAPRSGFYLVVEKILARHETLREDWPVEGTTGYEFTNLVLGLLIDPAGEEGCTRAYAEFAGETRSFAQIVREAKLGIMENEMASELNVLARDAGRVARQNPRTADFTRNILHRALREVVASFPVYRTYLDMEGRPSEADRRDLDWAIAQARRNETSLDPSVFDFVHRLLSGDLVAEPRSGFSRSAVLRCAMKLQQYSGPVMAKGLEDTAYYRYNRFVGLNEVGGQPDTFGVSLAAFHRANRQRAERWPHAMLATATHDTKRGEDARARLAVLSEMPEGWARHVQTWSRLLRARRGDLEGAAPPDRNDEYLLYQLLIGTWPMELLDESLDGEALGLYAERIKGTMIKSLREAKIHSTWAAPDASYEEATVSFAADALDPSRAGNFLASFLPFVARVARLGMRNTLVQTVLKLTAPGMPDIYQGTELWDFSMVDPDNRRPVDYALRARLLEEVTAELASYRRDAMRRYAASWRDARGKLAIIVTILDHRRDHAALFKEGGYEPLEAEGPNADQICAFLRRHNGEAIMTVAGRFPARLETEGLAPNTLLPLPEALRGTRWRDILCGIEHDADAALSVPDLLTTLPAAVLVPV
ncbi:MAG TPA: malto-oligosyltrehalose synthase, partial [Stellaceae bacterium]|nr:malto-oligosyltrehalose synthase [Stellaceae bacterium]